MGVVVLVAGNLVGSRASAVERTRGPSGLARWRKPVIVLDVVVPADLPQAETALLFRAAEAAAASWRTPCSSAEVSVRPADGRVYAASPDGKSTITVLPSVWCRAGQPARRCHDPRALAETTVEFERGPRAADGESAISEADVEINAVTFSWLGYQRHVDPGVPLQAVLSHEIGHVLGLDDGCRQQDKGCISGEPSVMTTLSHHGGGAPSPTQADLALLCTVYPRSPSKQEEPRSEISSGAAESRPDVSAPHTKDLSSRVLLGLTMLAAAVLYGTWRRRATARANAASSARE